MGRFSFSSEDGTTVIGWRNDVSTDAGIPVLICNGLGTPPASWPTVVADSQLAVRTWYYRGTSGGGRPADPARITVDDHVDDAVALLDHEGIDRVVVASWSVGVNVGFELARQHPQRVAGLLAVSGVPGGTFTSIGGPLHIPRPLRQRLAMSGAHVFRTAGAAVSWLVRRAPLNRTTALLINHSGLMMPAATPERLIPALAEFREHDFKWWFTLAIAAARHEPMDLSSLDIPVTLVAGSRDLITSHSDMAEAAARIAGAKLRVMPGSHFLPLEYPDELADELKELAERAGVAAPTTDPADRATTHEPVAHPPIRRSPS